MLRLAAIEPYAALSHVLFLEGLERHSRHSIEVLTLPPRGWKWRMRTASVHFARLLLERKPFDLLLVSDYLNLPELIAVLPPPLRDTPVVAVFHENQLTYPLRGDETRDHHFGLTHLHSILAASRSVFNSRFHLDSFFAAAKELLRHVPDVDLRPALTTARGRSSVLPLGIDVPAGEPRSDAVEAPVVLWSHRWEYDKDPDLLLSTMRELKGRGERFRLRVLGQGFRETPAAIDALRAELGDRLDVLGFLPDRADYLAAIADAHVVLSTARHEFFGIATLEALRSGCLGVLPDDLAYPELLPPDRAVRDRFLYSREEGPVEPLVRALRAIREGEAIDERRAVVCFTDRFTWENVAPRWDELFETVVDPPRLP